MSSDHPRYKLTYYNARGTAEPIRMAFAYLGIDYEDIRIPLETVSLEIIREIQRGYTSLPILEIDGVPYHQTFAILHHIAKKYGLGGNNIMEDLQLMECGENFREYFTKWRPFFYSPSAVGKENESLKQRILNIDTPIIMNYYNDILVKNNEGGSPWMFGNKMTMSDICTAHFTKNFADSVGVDLVENFPALKELQKKVFNQPGIKEWIQKRPDSQF